MKIFFSVGEPSGDVHGANLIRALKTALESKPDAKPGTESDSESDAKPGTEPDTKPGTEFGSEPLTITGFGGPKMAQAGCELQFDLTTLAVMWFGRVLLNLRTFFRLADQAQAYFRTEKPDCVILIDYPGFNWHIARRAKEEGIPVYYYSPPQLWGWASWRIKKVQKWVDLLLSGLSFEIPWYKQRNCPCVYVGHPFFDELVRQNLDQAFIETLTKADSQSQADSQPQADSQLQSDLQPQSDSPTRSDVITSEGAIVSRKPLTGILPGSRTQEVTGNLATFLAAVKLVHQSNSKVRFAIAAFKESHRELILPLIQPLKQANIDIDVYVGRTQEIMSAADCAMSVSGSVSLELLYYTTPTVILYRVSRLGMLLQSLFRNVKYITLVNLLKYGLKPLQDPDSIESPNPHEALFPEYLTSGNESGAIARWINCWLGQPQVRQQTVEALTELKTQVCQPGAAEKAAAIIVSRCR